VNTYASWGTCIQLNQWISTVLCTPFFFQPLPHSSHHDHGPRLATPPSSLGRAQCCRDPRGLTPQPTEPYLPTVAYNWDPLSLQLNHAAVIKHSFSHGSRPSPRVSRHSLKPQHVVVLSLDNHWSPPRPPPPPRWSATMAGSPPLLGRVHPPMGEFISLLSL